VFNVDLWERTEQSQAVCWSCETRRKADAQSADPHGRTTCIRRYGLQRRTAFFFGTLTLAGAFSGLMAYGCIRWHVPGLCSLSARAASRKTSRARAAMPGGNGARYLRGTFRVSYGAHRIFIMFAFGLQL
jgi:hypothetical protein